jgi:hypothetical protein
MCLAELLPVLQELSHSDKVRVLQFLVLELAKEERAPLMPELLYPIWSPYEAFDGAAVLLKVLERDKPSEHIAQNASSL